LTGSFFEIAVNFLGRAVLFPDFFQKVVAGPFWSKPLWDSDKDNDGSNDGFFGAPNIMSIAKIAVSVAGGGPWLAFALDAMDTAYNVAAGNMSLKDGAIGLAKGAAVATVSSLGVTSFIGNAVGTATAGLGSVVSSTLSAVAQNYSSSLINGAINAFNGENGWSLSSFKQSAKDGLKGAAIAGTTALVGGLINNANGQTFGKYKNPNGTESTGWHTTQSGVLDKMSSSISSIGNFWGGLAGEAMSFAMGDGFSLNMLNSADFGVGNAGLLELRIGGKQKNLFSFALGSGGADISDSMLNQMEAGQNHLNWVDKMMSSGAPEIAIQAEMAKINMMRWAGGRAAQLAELEVGGMIKSMFNGGDLNSSRGLMTTLGLNDIETDANGDITLASQARLAVRQTHESEHVMQNIASYSSGVSMMAMDRELGAHESGISAWQGLLSTFGSGLGSTSRGSANDQAFASEMSSLSLGMANGQLERHLGANYSMSGDDWAQTKYQKATLVNGKWVAQNQAVLNGNDTVADLYAKLGGVPEAEKAKVRLALVEKLKKTFPGMAENPTDDQINDQLKKMKSGDITFNLNWAQGDGYTTSVGLYDSPEIVQQMAQMRKTLENDWSLGANVFKGMARNRATALIDGLQTFVPDNFRLFGASTPEEAQRLAMEDARGTYNRALSDIYKDAGIGFPVAINSSRPPIITSGFGHRIDPISGLPSGHNGIDLGGVDGQYNLDGQSVVGINNSSKVLHAGAYGGYGNLVVYQMEIAGKQYAVWNAHLKDGSITVEKGQMINFGQGVGKIGSTGYSTGPHLHFAIEEIAQNGWSVAQNPSTRAWVNPITLLRQTSYYMRNRGRYGFN
jgi:murein DD-endopeptidase MepM/ murein hydrolase activator NlpD